ncbi:MAG TPA: cytochrome c oxidase subunit 3 [Chitinophagales bacterium]|nr:cytochrome c oxidase subunit 3 [Chitinophagales bacterium]
MRIGIDNTNNKVVWPLSLFLYFVYSGIVMLFIALSLAYLLNDKQQTWQQFQLPQIFWLSTLIVAAISIKMKGQMSWYQAEKFKKLRRGYFFSLILSIAFIICQLIGWEQLQRQGITLKGTPSASYLYVISGLHVLHILVGVVMLMVAVYRSQIYTKDEISRLLFFTDPIRKYRLKLLVDYWHTIDFLWIYLFLVFLFMHN